MTNEETPDEWLEVKRTIAADPATIFRLLCDPQGHVAIDSTGMLMDATGDPVTAAGDAGTLVTSYYDWSSIHPHWREAGIFPVVSEAALRATLGILARTVARGYIGRPT